MRTIDKIITKLDCKFGSPMGRSDVENPTLKHPSKSRTRIYDCAVPMCGAYDRGGAYWGLGSQLRVSYTKDLNYIKFYRK